LSSWDSLKNGIGGAILTARRRELLEEAARGCEALGARALAVPADVTDPS
jgi:NADP-dependent 3-hydroxy acid dehydrogenase YdfG